MKKIIKIIIIYFFFFSISISTFLVTYSDDMLFDIKIGEYILKYGIDLYDHFSNIPNLVYMYSHWLYDIVLFIFNQLGNKGIILFFGIIFSLLMYLLFKMYNKIFDNMCVSIIITIINFILLSPFITNRVQMFSYLLFVLEINYLNKLYNDGKVKYSIILFINSILLLNSHMTVWFFYLILFLPFIASIIVNKIKIKKIYFSKCANIKLFIITFIEIILSGLIGVFGIEAYLSPFKTFYTNELKNVIEMHSINPFNYPVYIIIGIIFLLLIIIPKIKIKIEDLCMLIGILILPLMAYRNLAFVYLILPYIIIKIISYNYNIKIKKININKKLCIFIYIILLIFSINEFKESINKKYVTYNDSKPINKAIKFIKNNYDYKNIRMYNDIMDGNYLIYNNFKVFLDMRLEVYVSIFNGGYHILSDSEKLEINTLLNKYCYNYALIPKSSNIINKINNDEWNIVYSDNNYIFYERIEKKELNYCFIKS